MKQRFVWLLSCALLVSGAALGVLLAAWEEPLGEPWKAVQEALQNQRPQTAIEQLEPIIETAMQTRQYAEATKAIALKAMLESEIQGGKPEERITRLEAAMQDLPEPMRPMMEVILAHWYWNYFQENRWRFLQRTQTAEPVSEDILTWDLPRILGEIDAHFTAALKADAWLRQTPVAEFDALLTKGTMPDSHRPTLFDFVVYEALRFYTAGEQAGAAAQDAFVLTADSPVLGTPGEFVAWEIATADTQSPTLKAIRLYQRLMVFHKEANQDLALAEADLSRLEFAFATAVGEEKNARYKTALTGFANHWKAQPIAARALAAKAEVLRGEGDLVAAHEVAAQGRQAFPDSPGGHLCHNLLLQIEAKEIQVSIERVWNNPWPAIQVEYRNLSQVHFRAVAADWLELVRQGDYLQRGVDDELRGKLLAAQPARSWSHDLTPTSDYQAATARFDVPDGLQPGYYFLIASPDAGFGEQDNLVMAQEFWVSPLALVVRTGGTAGRVEGFVLDADTGEPIAGATVRSWVQQRVVRRYEWVEKQRGKTDANGLFQIAGSADQMYTLLAEHNGHAISTQNAARPYGGREEAEPFERTVFFTDRALYRPGQTISYKGICVSVDQRRDQYQTLTDKKVTVVLEDANGQEVARQTVRSNKFGSVSGTFTAPRDRLTGRYTLRDAADDASRTFVSVEEYKRPKFKVELAAPAEAARLGDTVRVPGTARAYTGAAIGDAQVQYRVVREVRYPIWWYWRCWWNPPQAESQEIAHGTVTTGSDGKFTIDFTARPDPSVSEKDEPVFRFTVYADVTDISGETRSDQRSVHVAYTALQASLQADPWQVAGQDVKIRVTVESPDGEPRAGKGTIRVHQLQQPSQVQRARLLPYHPYSWRGAAGMGREPEPDLSNPDSWPLGPVAAERSFATDVSGNVTEAFSLSEAGPYRAVLEMEDGFGKQVSAILPLQVLDPEAGALAIKVPQLVAAPQWRLEPGATFTCLWGTGYEEGRAFVEVEHRGKVIQSYWTAPKVTQAMLEQQVTEAMRGGFSVRITQVRENRAYLTTRQVDVPWTNKQLSIKWEHFTSKLKPAQQETWRAVISGPDARAAVAEMVAALYDASLDAYLPHGWGNLQFFRQDRNYLNVQFENSALQLNTWAGHFVQDHKPVSISFRTLPPEIVFASGYGPRFGTARAFGRVMAPMAAPPGAMIAEGAMAADAAMPMALNANGEVAGKMAAAMGGMGGGAAPPEAPQPAVDLSQVSARKNLQETAFFFPHLVSDEEGKVTISFTMPEALTEWKFLGFAHDNQLRAGSLSDTTVTAKDLMVEPLAPRFVREGDELQFTVKVTNQSPTRQTGTVRLTLADARTLESVDAQLENTQVDQTFDIPAEQSASFSWKLRIPDGMGFLTYKAVGSTGRLSDGEEGYLPVLSRRVLVTESLPLPIRGAGTRQFEFAKLLASAESDSLQHQSLTVQMVSQPGWYAVLALPYLMEYPHECSEQVFNRLYANALAQHIALSDPKIRRVFDQWQGTEALDSPLEKNEELKAVMLEETPWVRQAQSESQSRRNVSLLFDANRLRDETSRTLRKLVEMQEADGSWPWFPGGRPNDYITLYITTGFGRLRHLGVDLDVAPAVASLRRLDTWIDEQYRRILEEGHPEKNHLTSTHALYLYGRSFFLEDQPIAAEHREAVDFFLGQARQFWTELGSRQSQAHLAVALHRMDDAETARNIMISLKERSVSDEEMGMFWRDTELSWWWYRAPIETQAMMIEAFDEVARDAESVEACRVWLLKQKQTQDWKTTKATADAVYSLLLRGTNLLASDALVEVVLGDVKIEPEKVEAGTGFYERKFVRQEVQPAMGHVTVTKTDPGVAWGSLHWQYLEDVSRITPHEGTPLTLKKQLFTKENSPQGPVLKAVTGPVGVGDELVVRIELRVDRDMEYVHLKDQRGSGLEPVNVLSGYRYQDGLAYYESTRDTASHFFIDYLPKGTYVFEYSTRVVHRGAYQSGMAEIQCMYAPEFNSHSESQLIRAE